MCASVCPTDTIRFVDEAAIKYEPPKPVQYKWDFGGTVIETRTVIGLPDTETNQYGYREGDGVQQ